MTPETGEPSAWAALFVFLEMKKPPTSAACSSLSVRGLGGSGALQEIPSDSPERCVNHRLGSERHAQAG